MTLTDVKSKFHELQDWVKSHIPESPLRIAMRHHDTLIDEVRGLMTEADTTIVRVFEQRQTPPPMDPRCVNCAVYRAVVEAQHRTDIRPIVNLARHQ